MENKPQGTFPSQNDIRDIVGFIQTVESVPTDKPKTFWDQWRIVTSGGSSRSYVYDTVGGSWKYTTLN